MTHTVKTFDKNNKELYCEVYATKEQAYEAYVKMVNQIKRDLPKLPKSYNKITVARFNNDTMMHYETITK